MNFIRSHAWPEGVEMQDKLWGCRQDLEKTELHTKPGMAGGSGDAGEALGLPSRPGEDCELHTMPDCDRREQRSRRSFGATCQELEKTNCELHTMLDCGRREQRSRRHFGAASQDLHKTVNFIRSQTVAGGRVDA